MFTFKSVLPAAIAAIVFSTGAASATSFKGEYWDSNAFSTIDQAYAYTEANVATATFTATNIDYPEAGGSISDNTTLSQFLGATGDGLSLSGASNHKLDKSVFKFSGLIDLSGTQTLKVGSDDGFGLKLNGVEVMRHSAPRAFAYTLSNYTFTGATSFELVYYENYGNTGVEFQINDQVVSAEMGVSEIAVSSVPVPAALPLLAGALGGLGLVRRRRAKRA